MKLSVLFLICSLSMTYAAESYAQKTMISLEVRNETVGTVLEKLKKESGFDFFFNNKHVDLKRIVSVSANNNNIFKILDQIFAGTNVKYSVLEKKIILSTEIVQGIQQEQNKVTGYFLFFSFLRQSFPKLRFLVWCFDNSSHTDYIMSRDFFECHTKQRNIRITIQIGYRRFKQIQFFPHMLYLLFLLYGLKLKIVF